MPLPKIEDARNLNDQELADEILAAKRQLFELRMQQATRRLEKTHQFKHLRHKVGQMMTVLRERERAAVQASPKSSPLQEQAPESEVTQTPASAASPQPDTQEEE
ncbi:MAG TPA: 50S ribosomal protein L29 [Cyanobacteria bacterium UBA8803]|nr:50S ribosomal protein L29 [Cyanobacteria bacterium UBA9273]HBL60898.1 50S ribosomal protein L29 [Cyanobacteria bacterium UBA8803]